MSAAVLSAPSAGASFPSSAALHAAAPDVNPAPAYTPVRSSVSLLSSRLANNALLLSSLSRLESLLPARVTSTAAATTQHLTHLSCQLADPLVTKVDGNLSLAIERLLSLQEKVPTNVSAADELAYAYTPERLKPAYQSTRKHVTEAVSRVQSIRQQRTQQLREALAHVSNSVQSVKAAIAAAPQHARQALDVTAALQTRLSELQAKLSQAIELAKSKTAAARALSQDILSHASDLTHQVREYIESQLSTHLSDSQREQVHQYWARLLEGISTSVSLLKETLHLAPMSAVSTPSSSRSDSAAESLDETNVAVQPAESESESLESHQVAEIANGLGDEHVLTEDNSNHADNEQEQEQEREHEPDAKIGKTKAKKRNKKREQQEEKSKIDSEMD